MSDPFNNMPSVGKKKAASAPSQPNRTPLLLGGIAGCLLLLLCGALAAGGGWLYLQNQGAAKAAATAPTAVAPIAKPGVAPASGGSTGAGVRVAYSIERGSAPEGKAVWLARADGSDAQQLLTQASSPVFAPDGSQVAYYHWNDGIYLANADGSNAHKILGESNAKYLAWSHDGKWIAFSSQPSLKEGAPINIDAIHPDGSGRRTIVVGGSQPSWSPDDTQVAFASCRGSDCGIFRANAGGGDLGTKVVADLATTPAWSPNGNTIVYQAEADGVKQLFVINVDGTGKKQLTSGTAAHVGAQWSPDGNTIYYRVAENGAWSLWRMNAAGTGATKLASDATPVDWAYERVAVIK